MVYKYISTKNIINALYDEGVKSTDFEGRIPAWSANALKALNCYKIYYESPVEVKIVDYKVKVPDVVESIKSIEYKGKKLYEIRKNRPIEKDGMEYERCYVISNGYIEFSFTDVTVILNVKTIPIEYDVQYNMYFPLMPDKIDVLTYLTYYCLRKLMVRGYKHPFYNLDINNGNTNINFLVDRSKRAAVLSINRMNNEQRRRISNILSRADVSPKVDLTRLFL